MTTREHKEREKLHRLWITGRANKRQMLRALELDHKARARGTSEA